VKGVARLAIVIVGLTIGLTSTIAGVAAAAIVDRSPKSFTLSSTTCANLPAGTTINGSGTQVSVTNVGTDSSGVTTIRNTTTTNGTATDQDGKTYVFHYSNEFRIANTLAAPDSYTGSMTDEFLLAGSGQIHLHNGFIVTLTVNADVTSVSFWNVRHAFGDPLKFETGNFADLVLCDPL
jgi:hypothetical protein